MTALGQTGLEVYGAAGGTRSSSGTITIEIALNRHQTGLWAMCLGGEGTAQVTAGLNGPLELQCQHDGAVQLLTDSLSVQGNRLSILVENTPANAAWAVAAASAFPDE